MFRPPKLGAKSPPMCFANKR